MKTDVQNGCSHRPGGDCTREMRKILSIDVPNNQPLVSFAFTSPGHRVEVNLHEAHRCSNKKSSTSKQYALTNQPCGRSAVAVPPQKSASPPVPSTNPDFSSILEVPVFRSLEKSFAVEMKLNAYRPFWSQGHVRSFDRQLTHFRGLYMRGAGGEGWQRAPVRLP